MKKLSKACTNLECHQYLLGQKLFQVNNLIVVFGTIDQSYFLDDVVSANQIISVTTTKIAFETTRCISCI